MGKNNKSVTKDFRQRTEELLKTNASISRSKPIDFEIHKLFHELEVHQIELKMQNEELMSALSERKRADESLIASENRYRRLFESAKDGILILDAETGMIKEVNPLLIEMLGYSEDQFRDKAIWEIGFFKDIVANLDKFSELQQKEYVRYDDLPLETADGRKISVEFISNSYFEDNKKVIQCNIRETTERKKYEDALLESEIKYRAFFENSMDAILLTSPDGKILSANQASCDMFGYSEDELIRLGKSGIVDRSDSRLSVLLEERRRNGKARGEVTFLRKDGTRFPAEISSAVFKNHEGLERNSMIIRDITERKKTEKEIKSLAKFPSENPNPILRISQNSTLLYVNEAGMKQLPVWNLQTGLSVTNILHDVVFNALNIGEVQVAEFEHFERIYSFYVTPFVKEGYVNLYGWDITERKRAEEKLKNSEERFKILFDCAPDAYYLNDLRGTFIDGNIAAVKMLGFNKNELIGKNFFKLKLLSPIQLLKASVLLAKNILGKATGPDEFVLNHKNGSKITVEISTYPVKIQDQSIVLGIARDITGRKQAETEIAMLAHSLKSINECVSITDLENKILFVNESFLKTYGYELNELIGEDISIVRSQSNEQAQVDEILPATIQGEWQGELMNRKKDASEFPIYLSTTIIKDKDGNPLGLIGVAKDITERKKNEYELKLQANLLNNVGQAVIATDLSGNVIYWNNAAEKIYGWSSAEAIGQNITSLTPAQTTLEQAEEIMKKLSEGDSWTGEFLVKRKGGSSFPAMVTDAPFFNSKEELAGIIGISSDITEHKLEETELIEAKEKAEESDRLKSAFLANMSHEVRTPLNSIIGFSELLGDPDFEEDQKNEFIQHIVASGNNLLTIISDIMDISKMESGEIIIRKKPINAHEYVLGIYEQFSFQAGIHKLELILNLPDNGKETEIFADAERLRQIFNNLIGNAFKFTSEGKIEIGFQPKGKMVEFFVKDTGIGIPASYHEKIFDRFRQVEDEKTRKYGGNGLGLAITKNLVGLMGGKIWLDSNEGKGSAFYFTMPMN